MNGFIIGLVIGLLGMLVARFFWDLIQGWIGTRNKFYQRQTVVHFTDKTPAQVYQQSKAAGFILFVLKFLAFSAGLIVFAIYFPSSTITICENILDIFQIFIQILITILQLIYTVINGL